MANSRSFTTLIKKNLYLILSIVFLSLSLIETIYLASQPQDTRNKATDNCIQCHCTCGKSFCADIHGLGCNSDCADACGKSLNDYVKEAYPGQSQSNQPKDAKCDSGWYVCNVGCCGIGGGPNDGKRYSPILGVGKSWNSYDKRSGYSAEQMSAVTQELALRGLAYDTKGSTVIITPNPTTAALVAQNPSLKDAIDKGKCILISGGYYFCYSGNSVGDPCAPDLSKGGDMCVNIATGKSDLCGNLGMIRCICANGVGVIGSGGQTCDNLCGGSNNICTSCTNQGEEATLPTKTPTPTMTIAPTNTPKATNTPVPSLTSSPTQTPKASNTPKPTATTKPMNTVNPIATDTPTPTPTTKNITQNTSAPTSPQTTSETEEVVTGPSPTRIVLPAAGFEFPSQFLTIAGAIVTLLGILVLL